MAYIATSMKLIKDTMLFACVYNLLPSFMRTYVHLPFTMGNPAHSPPYSLIANTFGGAERRVRDYVNFIGPQYQSQLARMANDPDWDGAEVGHIHDFGRRMTTDIPSGIVLFTSDCER